MKKIRHSFLLTVLLSSLGIQTTTAFAHHSTTETSIDDIQQDQSINQIEEMPIIEISNETNQEEDNKLPMEEQETSPSTTQKDIVETIEPVLSVQDESNDSLEITTLTSTADESIYEISSDNVTFNSNNDYLSMPVVKSTEEFILKIGEDARKIGQERDLYASVMIAQAILESGSGQSALSSSPNHNLFGIKGYYKEQSVSFLTMEDDGYGNLYSIQSDFRKYPSYKESLEDYADLMDNGIEGNKDFYNGVRKSQTETYQEATQFLTGKYATDTAYNKKLDHLIETYDLTFYDKKKEDTGTILIEGEQVESYPIKNPVTQQVSEFIVPLEAGYAISSPFGNRGAEHHDGIDLASPFGTPIMASSDGIVVGTGYDASAGNYVIIRHGNGLYSNYFHMSEIGTTIGDNVKAGTIIGFVGSTGNSTGDHLHYGISTEEWGGYMNPADYLSFN